MKKTLLSLFILTIMVMMFVNISVLKAQNSLKAVALGSDEKFSKYVLCSDGTLYRLMGDGEKEFIKKLNISLLDNYWYEFFISDNKLFLYAFNTTTEENTVKGEFHLLVVDLNTGGKVEKKIGFTLTNNTLEGRAVASAIAINNYVALQELSSDNVYLNLYEIRKDNISLIKSYNGRLMLSAFKYGNQLLITVVKNQTPMIINAITEQNLYALPSLVPVVELVNPIIQPFYYNGKWEIYVLIMGGIRGGIESYITKPNSNRFVEHPITYVHPLMHYAVVTNSSKSSTILFKDGYRIAVNTTLRPASMGNWIAMDPLNAVLDVDLKTHIALIKTIEDNTSKIMVVSKENQKVLLEIPAKKAFKEYGLHGAIVGNTVYIIDPLSGELIVKQISLPVKTTPIMGENENKMFPREYLIFLLAGVGIVIIVIISIAGLRRSKST